MRLKGDHGIVGRIIRINGNDCAVIGVMAADFDVPLRKATPVCTPSP